MPLLSVSIWRKIQCVDTFWQTGQAVVWGLQTWTAAIYLRCLREFSSKMKVLEVQRYSPQLVYFRTKSYQLTYTLHSGEIRNWKYLPTRPALGIDDLLLVSCRVQSERDNGRCLMMRKSRSTPPSISKPTPRRQLRHILPSPSFHRPSIPRWHVRTQAKWWLLKTKSMNRSLT